MALDEKSFTETILSSSAVRKFTEEEMSASSVQSEFHGKATKKDALLHIAPAVQHPGEAAALS
jgi:hypothetical protein